jgi:hypothetical protein
MGFNAPAYGAARNKLAETLATLTGEMTALRLASARVLAVPISNTLVSAPSTMVTTFGAATFNYNAKLRDNDDGTQSGLVCTVPASTTFQNWLKVGAFIRGPRVGLRLSRGLGAANMPTPFSARIDCYPVKPDYSQALITDTQQPHALRGVYRDITLGTDLGDGEKYVEIEIPADPLVDRTLTLLGWLVDASAGYSAPKRGMNIDAVWTLLTTTPTSFGINSGLDFSQFTGFYYKNVHASIAGDILVYSNLGSDTIEIARFTVAAGVSGPFMFPAPVPDGYRVAYSGTGTMMIKPIGEQ